MSPSGRRPNGTFVSVLRARTRRPIFWPRTPGFGARSGGRRTLALTLKKRSSFQWSSVHFRCQPAASAPPSPLFWLGSFWGFWLASALVYRRAGSARTPVQSGSSPSQRDCTVCGVRTSGRLGRRRRRNWCPKRFRPVILLCA